MNFRMPYFSYGTIYGVVRNYDLDGNDTGPRDITGYGIFFLVKRSYDLNATSLIDKRVGTGITIGTGTLGSFSITFSTYDLKYESKKYPFACFMVPSGTTFSDGTTQFKVIGSGVFEISKGVRYGTI